MLAFVFTFCVEVKLAWLVNVSSGDCWSRAGSSWAWWGYTSTPLHLSFLKCTILGTSTLLQSFPSIWNGEVWNPGPRFGLTTPERCSMAGLIQRCLETMTHDSTTRMQNVINTYTVSATSNSSTSSPLHISLSINHCPDLWLFLVISIFCN